MAALSLTDDIVFAGGFFAEEQDEAGPFRWTSLHAIIELAPADERRFLECTFASGWGGVSQVVQMEVGPDVYSWPVSHDGIRCSIPVPGASARVELRVDKRLPPERHYGDNRVLGVRIRDAQLHHDPSRHEACLVRVQAGGEPRAADLPQARRSIGVTPWPDRPKNWLDAEEDSLIPPRRLWVGHDDSITHYTRWIWEYLAYLTIVVGLERQDTVLELGCGHGRLARGLLAYLRSPGRYVGLDVNAAAIANAQTRITRRFPNFQFVLADVSSREYSPHGRSHASTYAFPFESESFDVAYAGSLFTHLLPDETANYFKETARVLKPRGRCLFSAFVLDYYRGAGTTTSSLYEFEHALPDHPGVATRDPAYPDAAIAYSLDALSSLAASAGLHIERVLPGLWTNSDGWAANEQDLLVLARGVRHVPPAIGGFAPPR